jgi:hypothetical protein
MNWLELTAAIASVIGLAGFYYLMALSKNSPQKLLGKHFRMPDVRLRYTPDTLYQTFEKATENGRPLMRRYWLYDFGLIACLLVIMLLETANVTVTNSWAYIPMFALTIARTAADIAEDCLFLHLLRRFPQRRNAAAKLAGAMTTLKHALLIAWLGLLFFLLILAAFKLTI